MAMRARSRGFFEHHGYSQQGQQFRKLLSNAAFRYSPRGHRG
jgi:hypothetical protein